MGPQPQMLRTHYPAQLLTVYIYLKLDGSSAMGGGLDMGRYGIHRLSEPTVGSYASSKGYVDRAITPLSSKTEELANSAVKLDGSTAMTGTLDSIKNLREPVVGNEAAFRGFVERINSLNVKYEGATADINMQQHRIPNLLDPREAQDCATKKYVDDSLLTDRFIGSYESIITNFASTKKRLIANPCNTIKVLQKLLQLIPQIASILVKLPSYYQQ